MTYTISDYLSLYNYLKILDYNKSLTFYTKILAPLATLASNDPNAITENLIKNSIEQWLRSNYSDRDSNKLLKLFFNIEKSDLPLYICDPLFDIYIRWRFNINK